VSKPTVTKLFLGSLIAGVAGGIMVFAAVLIAFANGVFVMDGPDVVGIQGGTTAWTLIGLTIVGGLVITGAVIGGLVSWIGALLNTAQLDDKLWFVLLLVLGIVSLGLVAMIAYVIAGPDGTVERPLHAQPQVYGRT
jgi:hypothetical protein